MHHQKQRMNLIATYICHSLQELYSPQELKSLTMIVCRDLLGLNAIDVYLRKDINLSEDKQRELESIVSRLQKNEPIQYVCGVAHFYGLTFRVAPGVLIPRPETEELVDLILKENQGEFNLLDIGTGSGCIAVSIAKNNPQASVSAWDVSQEALFIAQQNNNLLNTCVTLQQRDIFADNVLDERYHIIVSNPPYVTESEKVLMEKNVLCWEPQLALFVPDEDPLRFYRRIATLGPQLLYPGGKLYFEINQGYAAETVCMLEELHYHSIRVLKDLYGKNRIVIANC